eukprot:Transcript_18639.p1 GENE.Transcript_18639~~Transcript_18639.p1  ORF type:complete len:473 (-),score=252.37 Transcript_18639:68-1390(-)
MLAFGMKSACDKLPLTKPLKKHAEDFPAFIEDLDGWRERMRQANFTDTSGEECRDDMLHYYKLAMQASDIFRGQLAGTISFRWRDSFDRDEICTAGDFRFEAACALYNVAAATSFMATKQDRGSDEGMKKACQYFQEAAGILDAVKDIVKLGAWGDMTPDLTITCLDALQFLMLAQAQKCFYEKATRSGMKDGIVAKIAAECAGLYADASTRLGHSKIKPPADWIEVVEWNKKAFDGMQHYYAATGHEEAHEYGKQVSRLTYATNRAAEAVIMCKKAPKELQEQFLNHHTLANEKRAKAKSDNDLVYNEKVPPVETLPALERKAMVKAISPTELLELPPPPQVERQRTPQSPSAVNEVMQHLAAMKASELAAEAAAAPPSAPPPPPAAAEPPPPSFEDAMDGSVQQLMQMGFSKEASVAALQKAQGSVEAATDILLGGFQ